MKGRKGGEKKGEGKKESKTPNILRLIPQSSPEKPAAHMHVACTDSTQVPPLRQFNSEQLNTTVTLRRLMSLSANAGTLFYTDKN